MGAGVVRISGYYGSVGGTSLRTTVLVWERETFDVVAGCPGAADGSSTTVLAVSRLAGTEQSVWLFSRAE